MRLVSILVLAAAVAATVGPSTASAQSNSSFCNIGEPSCDDGDTSCTCSTTPLFDVYLASRTYDATARRTEFCWKARQLTAHPLSSLSIGLCSSLLAQLDPSDLSSKAPAAAFTARCDVGTGDPFTGMVGLNFVVNSGYRDNQTQLCAAFDGNVSLGAQAVATTCGPQCYLQFDVGGPECCGCTEDCPGAQVRRNDSTCECACPNTCGPNQQQDPLLCTCEDLIVCPPGSSPDENGVCVCDVACPPGYTRHPECCDCVPIPCPDNRVPGPNGTCVCDPEIVCGPNEQLDPETCICEGLVVPECDCYEADCGCRNVTVEGPLCVSLRFTDTVTEDPDCTPRRVTCLA